MDPTTAIILAFLAAFFIFCFSLTAIALVALGYRNSKIVERAIDTLADLGHQAIRKLAIPDSKNNSCLS